MKGILNCKGCSQISELCHTFKGIIAYLYATILPCILLLRRRCIQKAMRKICDDISIHLSEERYQWQTRVNTVWGRELHNQLSNDELLTKDCPSFSCIMKKKLIKRMRASDDNRPSSSAGLTETTGMEVRCSGSHGL